ncbi:calcium sensing receptor, chloroplastic [Salvia miltiorrhiza]|uniref:calcium sensing receptor, chloroplastic n=1 Tax=Salvia miltiorrhiza TaxID=226208 RepID=UPI0025AC554A|nr:calcium sensing receptor, chloroplastic [Salvia miltiorrhiza]
MALRATSTARPPSLPPSPPLSPPPKTVALPSKVKISSSRSHQLASPAISAPATAVLPLFALFAAPNDSRAEILPKEQIVSSLTQVESAIDKIGEVGGSLWNGAGQVIGAVTGAVKPGVDAALPILKQAGEQAVKIASPVVSEASKKAQEAIQSSGFDTEPVLTAAKTVADAAQQTTKVIDDAKPIAASTVQTISSAEPIVIFATGGALVIAYLLLPPVLSAISFNLRGYQGFLSPAQTLDLMSTKNYILVDIRSEKEKDKAGVPRLPSSAKNKLISIPLEELPSKVRSLVRNVKKVEAELVALKISYLKKVNKGSNIVILDSYCDSAKIVARTLTKLGFKNTWIVADGFSGSKGWLQSRLGADSYNVSFAEVVSPSRVISAASRRFGTTSSAKLLPGGSD